MLRNGQRFIAFLKVYPWLIAGFAGLLYRMLNEYAGIHIDSETWRNAIDVLSYMFIGIGVYSKHTVDKASGVADPFDKMYDL